MKVEKGGFLRIMLYPKHRPCLYTYHKLTMYCWYFMAGHVFAGNFNPQSTFPLFLIE